MNKGFTLIELLAVIVILAIIALIATPIVLGIINDSKESAVVRSAEFYVDAVKNGIMKKNLELNGTLNPEVCEVIDKYKVKCDEVEIDIEVDGEVPDSGTITFNRGKTTSVELIYGERTVITNANGELVLDSNAQVCTLIQGEPNEIGSKYECEVKAGTKYNFYVLSHEEAGTTNLIMERNICEDGTVATSSNKCTVAWVSKIDYNDDTNYGSYGNYNKGPITVMNYINKATSDWNNIDNLNLTYDDEEGSFMNFKIEGKARLPYHREVNAVGCEDYGELTCPVWMVDYLQDAGHDYGTTYQENPIDGIWGYWTFSSLSNYSSRVWIASYVGSVGDANVSFDSENGVRPVINLKL